MKVSFTLPTLKTTTTDKVGVYIDVVAWMVEKLAESKGDQLKAVVNVQNEEGNTPLHWGALNGHLAVVEILVKNGADCKVKIGRFCVCVCVRIMVNTRR